MHGGGNMFPTITNKKSNVGLRNIKVTKQLLAQVGFNLTYECVGGSCYRNITMDGSMMMKPVASGLGILGIFTHTEPKIYNNGKQSV